MIIEEQLQYEKKIDEFEDMFQRREVSLDKFKEFGFEFICGQLLLYRARIEYYEEMFNNNPDLKAIMEARDEDCDIQVCGDKVEIAKAYREELESSIANIPEECEELIMSTIKRIDEKYKDIFNKCGEEIYITVQRARQRIKKESKFIRDRFNEYEKGYLAFGEKDIKTIQCERAAKWLKSENLKGNKRSIAQAAKKYEEELEAEKDKGGYASVDALKTILYKRAEEYGIAAFKMK